MYDVEREMDFSSAMDIIGLLMTSLFVMIAAGGGIGGGGVLVPTYIFVFGFSPHIAIPLSTITILGSSIAHVIVNWFKKHPFADRPLIDWDMMLMMEPLTIAGTVVGSYLNVILPPIALCAMLVFLLAATTVKTMLKGIKEYKKESKQRDDILNEPLMGQIQMPETSELQEIAGDETSDTADTDDADEFDDTVENQHILNKIIDSERRQPYYKILVMLVLTFGVLLISILKGGHHVNILNIECGSIQYWVLSSSVLPFTAIIAILSRRYLVNRYYLKEKVGYKYLVYPSGHDIEWDKCHTITYPLICSIAGLCAGLFGIGGGIVKGPLMLQMGVFPQVASGTSSTMILLTAISAAVSYFIFNSLNLNFAIYLFPIGFVSCLIGKKILTYYVKKYNRSSLIIIIIAITVGASAIAMSVQSIIQAVEGGNQESIGFCN